MRKNGESAPNRKHNMRRTEVVKEQVMWLAPTKKGLRET
jgi:hypothetical protein